MGNDQTIPLIDHKYPEGDIRDIPCASKGQQKEHAAHHPPAQQTQLSEGNVLDILLESFEFVQQLS